MSSPKTQLKKSTNLSLTGRLQWLTRLQSRFRGTGEEMHEPAAPVTHKGREIGPPQLGSPLNVLPPASRRVRQPCDTVTMPRMARTSRRWHSLPPLPPEEGVSEPSSLPEEGAPEPPPKDHILEVEGGSNDLTDTEAVLNSLRPERLSLHHIKLPRHTTHDLASTGDPGVDKRNEQQKQPVEQQEQPVKREQRDDIIRLEAQDGGTTTNKNTLNVLPEEDASPESIFYTSLIDIVKAYYKEMSEVCLQPHETGQTSEDHWLREKWRQRSAMDKRLLAAERASGYKVSEPCKRSERIH